jgi:hypothetical protein
MTPTLTISLVSMLWAVIDNKKGEHCSRVLAKEEPVLSRCCCCWCWTENALAEVASHNRAAAAAAAEDETMAVDDWVDCFALTSLLQLHSQTDDGTLGSKIHLNQDCATDP